MKPRSLFTAGLLSLLLALPGLALATAPDQLVREATANLRTEINQNYAKYSSDQPAFYSMVESQVVPYFDTKGIASIILGSHRKDTSAEQFGRFETAFKDMLIRSYADRMLEYHDSVDLDVKPARIEGERALVDTAINREGQQPLVVTFAMRQVSGAWKIWDIRAENISLVLSFKSQIDSEIRKNGIDAVIEKLESGSLVVRRDGGSDT